MIINDPTPAMVAGLPPRIVRRSLEDHIARLIEILDDMDGDSDLEPSLGYSPLGVDLESDLADDRSGSARELDTSDDEPSLGWVNPHVRQAQGSLDWYGDSFGDDRELDDSDYEPDHEDGPDEPAFQMLQHDAPHLTQEDWIAAKTGRVAA